MEDARGKMLTRQYLRDPQTLAEAVIKVPGYPLNYNYTTVAHVRMTSIPLAGMGFRRVLDSVYAGWEEVFDWSLLLERESFFVLISSALSTFLLLLSRFLLGWYADRRVKIPHFHLRRNLLRAGSAFFTLTEIK